jgi:hypothetical protein
MLFMKNTTIVNIVLALAVAGLYMIYFAGNNKDKSSQSDKLEGGKQSPDYCVRENGFDAFYV